MKSMNVDLGADGCQKYGLDHRDSNTGNAETDADNTITHEIIKDNIVLIK